jgi:hypothetical protein
MPTLKQPGARITTLSQGVSVNLTPSPSPRIYPQEKSTFCRYEANFQPEIHPP